MLTVSIDRLEASVCRDSLFQFFRRFWSVVVSEPLVCNWHIKYLCDEVQRVAARAMKRLPKLNDLVINVPPGTSKSTICSVMLPAWAWANDPTTRLICGSCTDDLSMRLGRLSRAIITSEKYQTLFPYVKLAKENEHILYTDAGGWRQCASVGGSLLGVHAHIHILDDPLDPKGALSQTEMKSATDWMSLSLSSRKVDRRITPLILIMQRLHGSDPTAYVLNRGEPVKKVCLPAELTEDVCPRELREFYTEDGLMDPMRLNWLALESCRNETTEYGYAGQYLQSPIPLEGGMFRVSQIKVSNSMPRLVSQVRFWDKAATGGGGKFTVGVRMGLDDAKRIWIIDVARGQWESYERERRMQQTAAMDGKLVTIGIEQEPGSGGKDSALMSLRGLQGYRVRIDRPVGNKALRADPFASQVNGGNVYMLVAPWNQAYLDELQYFPNSKYSDQVDASSGCFGLLSSRPAVAGGLW